MTQQEKGVWKQLAIREKLLFDPYKVLPYLREHKDFGPFNSILLLSITSVHYK